MIKIANHLQIHSWQHCQLVTRGNLANFRHVATLPTIARGNLASFHHQTVKVATFLRSVFGNLAKFDQWQPCQPQNLATLPLQNLATLPNSDLGEVGNLDLKERLK